MKWLLILLTASLTSCATEKPQLGVSEKEWVSHRPYVPIVMVKPGLTVYRMGTVLYYFKDGRLDHVDEGGLVVQVKGATF